MSIQVTTGELESGSSTELQEPVASTAVSTKARELAAQLKEPGTAVNSQDLTQKTSPADNSSAAQDKPAEKEGQGDDKLKFSVDYSIPTLEEIALPGDHSTPDAVNKPSIADNPILSKAYGNTSLGKAQNTPTTQNKSKGLEITPELVDKLAAELHETLIPEIEKAVQFAFNKALAGTLDQASKIAQTVITKRTSAMLPGLLKCHLDELAKQDPENE